MSSPTSATSETSMPADERAPATADADYAGSTAMTSTDPSSSHDQQQRPPPQERYMRSRSRGRFSHVSNASSNRKNERSSSRASFLGRPRHRQIYEVSYGEGEPSGSAATRWRSESRTVRGSVDEALDPAFSDEEGEGRPDAAGAEPIASKGPVKSRKGFKSASISPPSNRMAPVQQTPSTLSNSSASRQQTAAVSQSEDGQNKEDIEKQREEDKPSTRLGRIPYPIAHFLGYRTKETENRALLRFVEKLPRKLETLIWAWIGAMIGLGFVMITFSRWDMFSSSSNVPMTSWTAPIIIGSFGASSVILYGTPASPLGQPKSFALGQFLSALVGTCILKLFELNRHYDPQLIDDSHSLVWVAGGISVATTVCAMILTDTVHPPGGATALLITTSPPVVRLGWKYLPVVLLSIVIMTAWAMLWMNLGRARYPSYWITPGAQAVSLTSLGLSRRPLRSKK